LHVVWSLTEARALAGRRRNGHGIHANPPTKLSATEYSDATAAASALSERASTPSAPLFKPESLSNADAAAKQSKAR